MMNDTLLNWIRHPLTALQNYRQQQKAEQLAQLRARYQVFRLLLDDNHRAVELLTELGTALRSPIFWPRYLARATTELLEVTAELVEKLEELTWGNSAALTRRQSDLAGNIRAQLDQLPKSRHLPYCLPLSEITPNMYRAVGGKAANLARLQKDNLFSIPSGFVVPVSICRLFLEKDDLYLHLISRLRDGADEKTGLPDQASIEAAQHMISEAPFPAELRRALENAASPFFSGGKSIAVRSSAVSEDSAGLSFAGQYVSVLNVVNNEQLLNAFRKVVASSFNARNLAYRQHSGMQTYEFDLAVLALEMVDVRSAGILFTVDPNFSGSGNMLISAVHGLGELAVSGSEAADVYSPPRDGSGPGSAQIAAKTARLRSNIEGGVTEEKIDGPEKDQPVLSQEEIQQLVVLGRAAEDHLGGPLDIEWAVDQNDKLVLLQARPLRVGASGNHEVCLVPGRPTAIVSGGQTASAGRGAGILKIVRNQNDLENLSEPPYILAMHQSLVEAVGVLRKVSALLVDLGNPADHLSCVAREYEIPMLTSLGNATKKLSDGDAILVDGDCGTVFHATPEEIERHRKSHRKKMAAWKEYDGRPKDPVALALYDYLVPLNLTDAYGPTFTIAECKSIHDIVRYAHEKAVLAMFEAGDDAVEKATGVIVHLDSEVPFHISLIDLGGGLLPGGGRRISSDQVLSQPFRALWRGVLTPGLNWGPAGAVATGAVVSRFLTDHRSARPIGMPNYALVTRDFLNLNARMDFHFTMVDAICGQDARLNYIKFRFKGGGTSLRQRCRRVQCLSEILSEAGFFCDRRDDLLTAGIQGGGADVLEEKLVVIGRLLGFTRLLDAVMDDDEMIGRVAEAFQEGNYHLTGLKDDAS